MTFLNPEFLYYMLLPLVILFAFLLTQKEAELYFFSKEVASKLKVSSNTLTQKARNALYFVIGVLLIIALAKPVIKEGSINVNAKSADIFIALDISNSMLAKDIYPNRLEAAKLKALTLIDKLEGERVGVLAFAQDAYLLSPPSFDRDSVAFLLKSLNTDSITQKGSSIMPLLEALNQNDKNIKYLLIVSDGGDIEDFSNEIAFAKEHNVKICVLAVATTKGSPIELKDGSFIKDKGEIVVSKLNENIASLAIKTGGVYVEGSSAMGDVDVMLKELQSIVQKEHLENRAVQNYTPLFYYPIALALLLLLFATSSIKYSFDKNISLLLLLFLMNSYTYAGVFDFMDVKEAKKAYEAGEYERASKLYGEYAQKNQNSEAYYNSANSLYKEQKYKEAQELYQRAKFDDKTKEANRLSNLGNAYAKGGNLESAAQSYESSLKLRDDKATRENLDEVKKLLQKQEKPNRQNKEENQENKKEDKQDKNIQNDKKQQQNEATSKQQDNKEDAFMEKWLDELNKERATFLYKLGEDKPKNSNLKPW